jgi:hypothetical protein
MMDRWLERLLRDVREGRVADLAGTRVSADVPLPQGLLDQIIAEKIRPGGPVREISVRPEPGRARVIVKMARPSFLPPISVVLTVEQQPDLPASPILVLRVGMLPGVAALLGTGISFLNVLPPGLRFEGDRLSVNLAALLNERGYGWALPYLRSINISFEAGRILGRVEMGF